MLQTNFALQAVLSADNFRNDQSPAPAATVVPSPAQRERAPLLLGCAIHNPSLYYLATLAAHETQSEPTQENITLCYESHAAMRSLQGFHVVRRAPGVLPLAGR